MNGSDDTDAGRVFLWTLLGIGYYLLLEAVFSGVAFLLMQVFPPLISVLWIGILVVPLIGHRMTVARMDPDEQRDERRGLGIGLSLFYGLACLSPIVICGGLLGAFKVH